MIIKEAKDKQKYVRPHLFFNSARTCFSIILKELLKDGESILMPAYIGQSPKEGSGVFDPIRQTESNYEFYRLKDNLQADLSDIEAKISNKKVKALLLIHYFGFPQTDIFLIKELCKRENVILIEDCAHTLTSSLSNHRLGNIGDIAFFSLHKLLACNDGGCLQINNPNLYNTFVNYKENISCQDLLQYAKTNIEETSKIRVDNYQHYLSLLRKDSEFFDIMYPVLEDGVVPLNFPIIIQNYNRFSMYNELIEKGIITVSLYYQMIEELDENIYPNSFRLSKRILNLPVHQDTTFEDILIICDVINNWEMKDH